MVMNIRLRFGINVLSAILFFSALDPRDGNQCLIHKLMFKMDVLSTILYFSTLDSEDGNLSYPKTFWILIGERPSKGEPIYQNRIRMNLSWNLQVLPNVLSTNLCLELMSCQPYFTSQP